MSEEFQVHRADRFIRGSFVAMANPCEVLIETSDEGLARKVTQVATREALRIERKFSRYRNDSIVHAINSAQGKSIKLDDETSSLIDFGATLWELTEGAFDITSGVLRHVWKFGEQPRVPTDDEIANLLTRIGWAKVHWHRPMLTLPAGMEIDFGGIGKEYAVDRAVALLSEITNAPMLINFGGDLRAAGAAPTFGAWQVGIESVQRPEHAESRIKLSAGALATSGDTRRCIEINGQRYGHIIDARTGWPTPNAPRSVTVAADTCSQAGTFTTLAMLQGEHAEKFLQEQGVQYWILR